VVRSSNDVLVPAIGNIQLTPVIAAHTQNLAIHVESTAVCTAGRDGDEGAVQFGLTIVAAAPTLRSTAIIHCTGMGMTNCKLGVGAVRNVELTFITETPAHQRP
tara:strand:- start:69 stop:380 length:312 start_codon:yes stop_codon:yes gene_type:complete